MLPQSPAPTDQTILSYLETAMPPFQAAMAMTGLKVAAEMTAFSVIVVMTLSVAMMVTTTSAVTTAMIICGGI